MVANKHGALLIFVKFNPVSDERENSFATSTTASRRTWSVVARGLLPACHCPRCSDPPNCLTCPTLGRVWLGLTLDCAQCHSHKYDPVSQREFYQLYAFFNSLAEVGAGGKSGFYTKPVPPVMRVPRPGQIAAAIRVLNLLTLSC